MYFFNFFRFLQKKINEKTIINVLEIAAAAAATDTKKAREMVVGEQRLLFLY